MSELLTLRELLTFLQISRPTAYRLLSRGMPSIGTGRLRRFEREAVLRWYEGDETPAHIQPVTPEPALLPPGLYRCQGCHWVGHVPRPFHVGELGPCPRCGGRKARRADVG